MVKRPVTLPMLKIFKFHTEKKKVVNKCGNFVTKYQTIIDNHYFDIMAGFPHTHLWMHKNNYVVMLKTLNLSDVEVSQILFGK